MRVLDAGVKLRLELGDAIVLRRCGIQGPRDRQDACVQALMLDVARIMKKMFASCTGQQ